MKSKIWFPVTVVVMAAAGLIAAVALPVEFYWFGGNSLLAAALSLSAVVRQKGPLRQASLSEPEDERERSWREQANRDAFGVVSVIAMLGMGCYGFWMLETLLRGRGIEPMGTAVALLAFTMFLFSLFLTLPSLFANWTKPDVFEDEPEDRLHFLKSRRR